MLEKGRRAPRSFEGEFGSPFLLVFFKTTCPTCQLALPFLDRLEGGELPVIAVSQDSPQATAEFQRAHGGGKVRTEFDRAEEHYPLSNAFGISRVPSLFLVEADGNISLAESGFQKTTFETLGQRAGVPIFKAEENVPSWKAG